MRKKSTKILIALILLLYMGEVKSLQGKSYSHYLKLYEKKYYNEEKRSNDNLPLLPKNMIKLAVFHHTIEPPKDSDLEGYIYVSFKTISGHRSIFNSKESYPNNYVMDYVVALSPEEVNKLYELYGTCPYNGVNKAINKSIIQREDIFNLHQEMIEEHPELFPYGTELNYGVEIDTTNGNVENGYVEFDENGYVKDDSPLEYYQQGKTIVMPTTYSPSFPTRFFFNMNNPTVREYIVRCTLKILNKNKDNALFIDNIGIIYGQYRDVRNSTSEYSHYISSGNIREQTERYFDQTLWVLKEIKKRTQPNPPKIIINGLRDNHEPKRIFFNKLKEDKNFTAVDGLQIENRFWFDDEGTEEYNTWCTDIDFYLKWIKITKEHNKKIFFATSYWDGKYPIENFQKDSPFIYYVWLWLHLVADDNMYVYINDNYQQPMIYYDIYDYPLGMPLEEPHKEKDTWYRKYERGTIVFDTSSGKLSAIKFIEKEPYINIYFDKNKVCRSGILYLAGETEKNVKLNEIEPVKIEQIKLLDENNNILLINLCNNITLNEDGSISGHILVKDIIKRYPLINGIKVYIKVSKGYLTKEAQTQLVRIEPDKTEMKCFNNVFNPLKGQKAIIRVELKKRTHVRLVIYNSQGKRIKELADEEKDVDLSPYYWDGTDEYNNIVGSGLYVVHIKAGEYKETRKIVIVK